MAVPFLFLAVPPLLLLYPLSYVVWLYRLFDPNENVTPRLLVKGSLVDPTDPKRRLVSRIGENNDALRFCEDVLIWEEQRTAIFSGDPGRDRYNPFSNHGDMSKSPQGRLMLYNVDDHSIQKLEISQWPAKRPFHPLGIGILVENENEAILAVANLGNVFSAIEIFRLRASQGTISATYLHSLQNPDLSTPNAVEPLSANQVVVTNSFGFPARDYPSLNHYEFLLALPLGTLKVLTKTDSDTATCETLAGGIALANGLAISEDGKVIVVASSTAAVVHVYDVNPPLFSKALLRPEHVTYRESIPVGFLMDNLRVVRDTGTERYVFLGGGHPSFFKFGETAKSKGEGKLAPSRFVKISVLPRSKASTGVLSSALNEVNRLFGWIDPRVQIVFDDNGELLGTGCTAEAFTGKDGRREMLVSGLWDKRGSIHAVDVDV